MINKTSKVIMQPITVDLETTAESVSLSTSTVQNLIRKGEFPAPRILSKGRVGWLVEEIQAWAKDRPISDLPPPPNTGAKKPRIRQQATQDDRTGV